MTRVSDLLELQVPGVSSIDWDSRLNDLAHQYCADDIHRRLANSNLTGFGLAPCSRREVVMSKSRWCFGHDVVTHLNFVKGHLCAIHQFFPSVTQMDTHEYYAALDEIRRRLVHALGPSMMRIHTRPPVQVSFRWQLEGMHAELRSCDSAQRDLSLAVNDPKVCAWCMYWR
jgi:hypothetical protein